jgi:hypothetical protein
MKQYPSLNQEQNREPNELEINVKPYFKPLLDTGQFS